MNTIHSDSELAKNSNSEQKKLNQKFKTKNAATNFQFSGDSNFRKYDILNDGRRLYSSEDIKHIFDIGRTTVEQWRLRGVGPKFIRLGGSRLVRYRREDILEYIDNQIAVHSTTEADAVGKTG